MLEIVKDMHYTIYEEKRKVLIHCHAGYGRTGIVIACYMIFDSNRPADEVIKHIRSKRVQCIQKKQQYEYCTKFKYCILNI
jgi:protein tyrosine phosphatase domain-containing protein 1